MIISFDLYKNPVHAITQFTGIFIIKSRPKSLVHLVSCPLRWQWMHFLYDRSIEFCEIWSVCHWYSNVSDKSIEKGMGTVIFSVWYLEVEKTVWLSCPLCWNCPHTKTYVLTHWRWVPSILELGWNLNACYRNISLSSVG